MNLICPYFTILLAFLLSENLTKYVRYLISIKYLPIELLRSKLFNKLYPPYFNSIFLQTITQNLDTITETTDFCLK